MSTDTQDRKVFTVARSRLPDLRDRLDTLIRRADRLGVAGPIYEVGPIYEKRIVIQAAAVGLVQRTRPVLVCDVTVSGVSPKLDGGWRLAAAIDHTQFHPTLGWMVRRVPDLAEIALPAGIERDEPVCDHCGTTRERKTTFLLLSEAGEWKRVGRQCLRDFLGRISPESIAAYFEAVLDFMEAAGDEDWVSEGGSRVDLLTLTFLIAVAQSVRLSGKFVTLKQAQGNDHLNPTAGDAYGLIFDTKAPKPEGEDAAVAAEVIAWGKTLSERPNLSDYERNIAIALYQETMPPKSSGLVASAWLAWARETDRMPPAMTNGAPRKASVHQGAVGLKITRTVRVIKRFDTESMYRNGTHSFHILEDDEGNTYTWSTETALGEGDTYTITGTVKDHTEYKGRPQTVLTRCKATEIEAAPLDASESPRATLDMLLAANGGGA